MLGLTMARWDIGFPNPRVATPALEISKLRVIDKTSKVDASMNLECFQGFTIPFTFLVLFCSCYTILNNPSYSI